MKNALLNKGIIQQSSKGNKDKVTLMAGAIYFTLLHFTVHLFDYN